MRYAIISALLIGLLGRAGIADCQDKTDTVTYTGQITKIDKKAQTITIKGPHPGLLPDQPSTPRGRGAGGAAPPAGGRRGTRGGAGSATPRGPDMRAFEDVETKIQWTEATEVDSTDGTLPVTDLKVGDYPPYRYPERREKNTCDQDQAHHCCTRLTSEYLISYKNGMGPAVYRAEGRPYVYSPIRDSSVDVDSRFWSHARSWFLGSPIANRGDCFADRPSCAAPWRINSLTADACCF